MKLKIFLLLLAGTITLSSCRSIFITHPVTVKTNGNGNVPPGQMKKMTGSKSAKAYAPGQTKKKKHKKNK